LGTAVALVPEKEFVPSVSCERYLDVLAEDLDSANTMALVSTIGFAVGIPAAAVGVVLLVTGSSKKSSGKRPPGLTAEPYVGFGTAGVVGTF